MTQNIIFLQELSREAVDNDLFAIQLKSGFGNGRKDIVVRMFANEDWSFYRYFVHCVIGGTEVAAEGQCAVRKSDNECFSLIRASGSRYCVSLGKGKTAVFELVDVGTAENDCSVEDLVAICRKCGWSELSSDVKLLSRFLAVEGAVDAERFEQALDKTIIATGKCNFKYALAVYRNNKIK